MPSSPGSRSGKSNPCGQKLQVNNGAASAGQQNVAERLKKLQSAGSSVNETLFQLEEFELCQFGCNDFFMSHESKYLQLHII